MWSQWARALENILTDFSFNSTNRHTFTVMFSRGIQLFKSERTLDTYKSHGAERDKVTGMTQERNKPHEDSRIWSQVCPSLQDASPLVHCTDDLKIQYLPWQQQIWQLLQIIPVTGGWGWNNSVSSVLGSLSCVMQRCRFNPPLSRQ